MLALQKHPTLFYIIYKLKLEKYHKRNDHVNLMKSTFVHLKKSALNLIFYNTPYSVHSHLPDLL